MTVEYRLYKNELLVVVDLYYLDQKREMYIKTIPCFTTHYERCADMLIYFSHFIVLLKGSIPQN